jgi:hypothetical protein
MLGAARWARSAERGKRQARAASRGIFGNSLLNNQSTPARRTPGKSQAHRLLIGPAHGHRSQLIETVWLSLFLTWFAFDSLYSLKIKPLCEISISSPMSVHEQLIGFRFSHGRADLPANFVANMDDEQVVLTIQAGVQRRACCWRHPEARCLIQETCLF